MGNQQQQHFKRSTRSLWWRIWALTILGIIFLGLLVLLAFVIG